MTTVQTIQMKDVLWDRKVARTMTRDGHCTVCRKPYAAFMSFRIAIPRGSTLHRPMKFVNLPCWHIGESPGTEVAPDVRVRLLLVAEDGA